MTTSSAPPRTPAALDDFDYRDTGCEFSPRCLDCPLPRCVEEERGGAQAVRLRLRDLDITERFRRGEDAATIASVYCIAPRQVARILRGYRG